eukprot:CAMPEP_0172673644 /NCGR_PEP_ID=MMETSP1074-20121228/12269_1 /TAXON_ID=2916 /ORGANISM="Ceratium fusus, Strain PA161109" /LENGTH=221 /DNA_ID=CAMNT_0013490967 /DNA_START=170 /DNA_END=835 /DNA_ORIENTATION=+
MNTLSCVAATLAGSVIAIMKKTRQRPYVARHAKDVPPPDQEAQPDKTKLLSSQSGSENTCSACGGNTEVGSSRRHFSLLAGLLTPSVAANNSANAEKVVLSKTNCVYCGGKGLLLCDTCFGSGEMKMQGVRNGNPEAAFMYTTCQICEGNGDLVCSKCFGTGLPAKPLRGFLKDPLFQKSVYYMKVYKKRRSAETLKKLQEAAREAVLAKQQQKAAKAAEA